jgi:hypothetical protein
MPRSIILSAAVFATFTAARLADETVPFDDVRWKVEAKDSRVEDYLGKKALLLKDGVARLTGAALQDGTIEFDIAFGQEPGFSGLLFRAEDDDNAEEFYLRHHLSEKPDANQYSPVFNGVSAWQIFTGPRYCTPARYPVDQWMHVTIVVSGTRATVAFDGAPPALVIPELKRTPLSGGLILYSRLAPARFASFSYRTGTSTIDTSAAPPEEAPRGAVSTWEVSSPFDETLLDAAPTLPATLATGLTWASLDVERNGIANLARRHGTAKGKNTVLARVRFASERAQVKKVRFGFSDRVKVYLNGRLLYAGDDGFRSRDYRFLGTVGLWDALYLPLDAGNNELIFAVSETFGGWAVICEIADRIGLKMWPPLPGNERCARRWRPRPGPARRTSARSSAAARIRAHARRGGCGRGRRRSGGWRPPPRFRPTPWCPAA